MPKRYAWLVGLLGVLGGAGGGTADDAADLANRIDRHVTARLAADGVPPAPLASDAEFLSRVYLDLAGRIPTVSEARAFLSERSTDKRRQLVERLLDGPDYVTHWTRYWRTLLLPEFADPGDRFGFAAGLENWLRPRIAANTPYDQLVRELMTHRVTTGRALRVMDRELPEMGPSPEGFYLARDIKAENLAAGTSRLFLGVRLECAQCHHHPFAPWKREQFWAYAAFFAGLEKQNPGDGGAAGAAHREDLGRWELRIPGTSQVVAAAFLDGKPPRRRSDGHARTALAEWITAAENPFFAHAAANRLWAYFFGTGLVDPVDDMRGPNAPSHPELLDDLSRQLVAHRFDLKFLMRAVALSKTYQSTSRSTHPGQDEPQRFARMAVKGLTAEQLYANIVQAANYHEPRRRRAEMGDPRPASVRQDFLARFSAAAQEKSTEAQTSILQAFALMNGPFTDELLRLDGDGTLARVANDKSLATRPRIETLFLATLSRLPTAAEVRQLTRYVEGGGPDRDPKNALADVFWALLNSGEFFLNH